MKLKKLVGIVFIILCLPLLCAAQGSWEVIQMTPSMNLSDLYFLADGQHGWAVGGTTSGNLRYSAILHTTNGGETWEHQSYPGSNASYPQGVHFATPDSGWIICSGGEIYATSDAGESWTSQNSGTGRKLARIHFINSLEGWICGGLQDGNSYLVLKTSDGGNIWENISFGNNAYSCEDIYFHDSLNGWICGDDNMLEPHIHRTTNGGSSWERQTVPMSSATVFSIDFATSEIGWASTSSLYTNPLGGILHTTDGGENWIVQGYTNMPYNYCLDVRDSLNIAIASFNVFSSSENIYISSNGGDSWVPHPLPVASYTYGIQYVNDNIWVATNSSQILRSYDNGDNWEWESRSPIWNSIAWSDSLNGWAAAGSFIGSDCFSYKTTDGGLTWDLDSSAPGGKKIIFHDPDTGWMLREGDNATVWRTLDAGETWSQHYIGGGGWIGNMCFATTDSGWAVGSNGKIRNTSDGGINWTAQVSGTANYVQAINFVNSSEGWAAGGYGGGNGFILHTTNGGENWDAQTPAFDDHILDIFFLNSQEGWLTTIGGRIQKTVDGGESWQLASQVTQEARKILMINSQEGWLLAKNGNAPQDGRGFIYKTENGGNNWTAEWSGTLPNSGLYDFARQSDNILWACGYHNTILKSELPTSISENPSLPMTFKIYPNYPNPFNAQTKIKYELSHQSHVTIDIYNILGGKITTLYNGLQLAGQHMATWNADEHSSGIYFYRIQADDYTETKKMVLLR